MSTYSLHHLSDDAVTLGLHTSSAEQRQSDALLLAHIAEFDRRRLFLPTRFPSTFRYCVGELRMSEDMAFKRVRAARVALRFPFVFDALADGRLNLSGVTLLARRLTGTSGRALLEAAMHRSRAEIQELLSRRSPSVGTPAIPATAMPGAAAPAPAGPAATSLAALAGEEGQKAQQNAQAPGPVEIAGVFEAPAPNPLPELKVRVTPIAPGRYELNGVIGRQAYDALMASRELLGHAIPSGNLAEVLERAIALQYAQLRKRRCGAADRPRTSAKPGTAAPSDSADPRHVPDAVRRAVWQRDGDRCAFTGSDGQRCEERGQLELDHIVPVARGGRATVENLRLLCRPHNQYVAEREYGKEFMRDRREAAKRRAAEARMRKSAKQARMVAAAKQCATAATEGEEAAMARAAEAAAAAAACARVAAAVEAARQIEEVAPWLRALGFRATEAREAAARCVTLAGAPLEERVKFALRSLAPPSARREAPPASNAA